MVWLSLTLVSDLSIVAAVVISSVGDDLCAAIGEQDAVFTCDNVAIRVGVVTEVQVLIVIYDVVGEVEWHTLLVFFFISMGWCMIRGFRGFILRGRSFILGGWCFIFRGWGFIC